VLRLTTSSQLSTTVHMELAYTFSLSVRAIAR